MKDTWKLRQAKFRNTIIYYTKSRNQEVHSCKKRAVEKQSSKQEAMRMFRLLNWRSDHACEAAAIHVVLGCQGPLHEHE